MWALAAIAGMFVPASGHTADRLNEGGRATMHERMLDPPDAPAGAATDQRMDITIEENVYPNLPAHHNCRMEIFAVNHTASRVELRSLFSTRGKDKGGVDSWLVPFGELGPGDEVKRVYSCSEATSLEISRTTPYGWPAVCRVDGVDVKPCPVRLHVVSSLVFSERD